MTQSRKTPNRQMPDRRTRMYLHSNRPRALLFPYLQLAVGIQADSELYFSDIYRNRWEFKPTKSFTFPMFTGKEERIRDDRKVSFPIFTGSEMTERVSFPILYY